MTHIIKREIRIKLYKYSLNNYFCYEDKISYGQGMCRAMRDAAIRLGFAISPYDSFNFFYGTEHYPELDAFTPPDNHGGLWFPITKEGHRQRRIILIKAIRRIEKQIDAERRYKEKKKSA